MVSVLSLAGPILSAAVLVGVANSILHIIVPVHHNDWPALLSALLTGGTLSWL